MKINKSAKHLSAAMPLKRLIDLHYIPAERRRGGNRIAIGARRIRQLNALCRQLAAFLQREPVIGDLTDAVLKDFGAWFLLAFPGGAIHDRAKDFRCLQHFCGLTYVHRRGRGKRSLSDEPGTLWHICCNEYFPTNPRITNTKTTAAYRIALCDFKEALGHEPTLADLEDDKLGIMLKWSLAKGHAAKTANERAGRIKALWKWTWLRAKVRMGPTVGRLRCPRRIPKAWTESELSRLFASLQQEEGDVVEGIRGADWWLGLHLVIWDGGERIGAVLALDWTMLDFDTGYLEVPYGVRKGQSGDILYRLHDNTLDVLARMKPAGHELIFPWPYSESQFYNRYNAILKRVALPTDSKSKTHKMRKSVASHLQAVGVDACAALGHSSPQVTRDCYLDPRIVAPQRARDVLFRPENQGAKAIVLPALSPKRLEYRQNETPDESHELGWL